MKRTQKGTSNEPEWPQWIALEGILSFDTKGMPGYQGKPKAGRGGGAGGGISVGSLPRPAGQPGGVKPVALQIGRETHVFYE